MIQVFSSINKDFINSVDKTEKELNSFLSENFKMFFPELILIKSEFTLDGVARSIGTSGRIDIFAFNSRTNKFVIIELKRDLNKNIRNQASDYKDFIEDNFSDIYISVLQDHEIELPKKKDIVSDSFELILIAKDFSELDKYKKNNDEITFIKYLWLEGDFLLLQYLNNQPSYPSKRVKSPTVIILSKNDKQPLNTITTLPNLNQNRANLSNRPFPGNKNSTPSAKEWVKKVPDLNAINGLNNWKDICDHLKIPVEGDSARRRLKIWIEQNRKNWEIVPEPTNRKH
jgi:hypothetical protein